MMTGESRTRVGACGYPSKVVVLLLVVTALQLTLMAGLARVIQVLPKRGDLFPRDKHCEKKLERRDGKIKELEKQLASLRAVTRDTIATTHLAASQAPSSPTMLTTFAQAGCKLNATLIRVDLSKCDVACLRKEVQRKEEQERMQLIKSSLCLTSATACKIRDQEAVRQRKGECRARKFDPRKDLFDVVVPWTNLSESSYFDVTHPEFLINLERLRHPYKGVASGRPPFSEVVFALRSLQQHGFMERVGHVFLLYDDDQHGPPQFLRSAQSRVVPLPASLLTAGTPFVNRRRRLHTTLAYLHHIPGLSDFVFFLPDDCVMLRKHRWDEFFAANGDVVNVLSGRGKVERTGLREALRKVFSRDVTTGLDLHAPFFVKKCYLEEMEVEFCRGLPYECDPDPGPKVCALNKFHFQLWAQNYQAVREGQDIRKTVVVKYATELHTNKAKKVPLDHFRMLLNHANRSGQLWFNLQGNGVSDEYTIDKDIRILADSWYYTKFPVPAPWEVPGFLPPYVPPPEPKTAATPRRTARPAVPRRRPADRGQVIPAPARQARRR